MEDADKTKEQLIVELAEMRQRVVELTLTEGRQVEAGQQKRLPNAEREQIVLTEALYWAGAILGSTLNYDKVLDHIMEQIGRVVAYSAACVILIEGKVARIFRWRGYSQFGTETLLTVAPFNVADLPTLRVIQDIGWPLATPYVADHNEWRTMFGQTWVRSAVDVPLRTRNRLVGFLHVDSETAGFYTQNDAERLQIFANQAAIALENARLYDRARREIVRQVKTVKKERNFISAILDTAEALVIVLDPAGRIVRYNRACERITGYAIEEMRDLYLWDKLLIPEEVEPFKVVLEQLQTGTYPIEHECHWLTKSGQRRLVSWSNTVLFEKGAAVKYVVSTGIDITERKQAEAELKSSEERLKILFEFAPDAYYLNDMTGALVDGNKAAEALIGYPKEVLIGKNFLELNLLTADEARKALSMLEKSTLGLPTGPDEFLLRRKDGSFVPVEIRTFPATIRGRMLVLGLARDITERKRAETEREKLIEELNAFAHTVAHDLQGILARMIGYADLLAMEHRTMPPEQVEESLQLIIRNGRKMSNIIDELMLLSGVRQREVTAAPLEMAKLVAEAQQRLAELIEQSKAEIVVPEGWIEAVGYGPWIEEVWVNYLSNGIKYGGSPPRLELGSTLLSTSQVRFWVRDNGLGLSPEEQARLFQPFIQLDPAKTEGHGLGLSIVKRIIEKLGGEVGVESEGIAGQGSTFSFTLPAVSQPVIGYQA
jgi:PAS domain S-box-containing protein